jgi:hypothetical protein
MSDKLVPARFLVRQGTKEFMVYDRETRGPAMRGRTPAIGLSREEADRLRDWLVEHPPAPQENNPQDP